MVNEEDDRKERDKNIGLKEENPSPTQKSKQEQQCNKSDAPVLPSPVCSQQRVEVISETAAHRNAPQVHVIWLGRFRRLHEGQSLESEPRSHDPRKYNR